MRYSIYKRPKYEPIHLTEAKLHLRLAVDAAAAATYTDEDTAIKSMISSARYVAEAETWRKMVLQTVDLYLDKWPSGKEIEIPFAPLREIVHIKYTNSAGTETEFTEFTADTDSIPGRAVLNYEKTWPSDTLTPKNPIQVRFKCGHIVPFTADSATDTLTATDHPFSDADIVQLSVSGGSLPAELAEMADYHVRDVSGDTFKLAATAGGSAISITDDGTDNMFVGEVPHGIKEGMLLVLTDFYEERADTIIGKSQSAIPSSLVRGASALFAMDSAKRF